VFYVNLQGQHDNGRNRREVLESADASRLAAYRHRGRFRLDALNLLDAGAPDHLSGQFQVRLKKSGEPAARNQDALLPEAFLALLDTVRRRLAEAGRRILDGDIAVDPYRLGSVKACDDCEYRSICRIDLAAHAFRTLRDPNEDE
jgi:ATP-dependent helicase/nuclease subunit B